MIGWLHNFEPSRVNRNVISELDKIVHDLISTTKSSINEGI
jgi:hypothetical protein